LTNQERRNIINPDLWQQNASGRLQIGTPAGFRSEQVAGFVLECMAGFVGIRKSTEPAVWPMAKSRRHNNRIVTLGETCLAAAI
jgi:hypothetical protein